MSLAGVTLDASIGTAITPEDGNSLEELMTAADRAMYVVKDRHTAASEASRRAELDSQLPNEFRHPAATPRRGCSRRIAEEAASRWVQPALEQPPGAVAIRGADLGARRDGRTVQLADARRRPHPSSTGRHSRCSPVTASRPSPTCTALEIGSLAHLSNDVFTLCMHRVHRLPDRRQRQPALADSCSCSSSTRRGSSTPGRSGSA